MVVAWFLGQYAGAFAAYTNLSVYTYYISIDKSVSSWLKISIFIRKSKELKQESRKV